MSVMRSLRALLPFLSALNYFVGKGSFCIKANFELGDPPRGSFSII